MDIIEFNCGIGVEKNISWKNGRRMGKLSNSKNLLGIEFGMIEFIKSSSSHYTVHKTMFRGENGF
jgi:hypothetical protein